jgi:tetratricopeptide (TPR) repeat protein
MKLRKSLIATGIIALLGAGAWFGWRWYSTPSFPDIPLTGADKPVVDAIEEAKREVSKQPRSGATWGKLAKVLAVNGYRVPAIQCFARAASLDRFNPRWPYLQGVELLKGDPHQGILRLREALKLARSPDDQAAILFRLSTVLIEDGQLDEARQHLQTLDKLEPAGARVTYGLGLLAIGRQDWTEARNYLSKLCENPIARKQACTLLATLPNVDRDQAQMYQQKIARLPQDLPWPDIFVGEMSQYKVNRVDRIEEYWELERQGRREEAIERLRGFVAESPSVESCSTLGFALYKMNEFQEAAEALRAAIGFDPQNARSHYLLGASLLGLGEKYLRETGGENRAKELFRQAIVSEDQALALQSQLGYAHLIRGRAFGYLGLSDQSIKALREALLSQPESAEIHESLGVALANSGQLKEALTHLENAVRLASPNDPHPREVLEKWRAKVSP